MTTDTARIYDTAANIYLGWVDASINANERFARIARIWLDETLGAQQDVAQTLKRSIEETQATLTEDGEQATPITFISRAGDIARANYYLWTETGLKAQERFTRVAQAAFEELRTAQSEFSSRAEEQFSGAARR
jgi:hypothetical protein